MASRKSVQAAKRKAALKSPLTFCRVVWPETHAWSHLELLDEHLVALFEYRLTEFGPAPPGSVSWVWNGVYEVSSPWEIPFESGEVQSFEGRVYDPMVVRGFAAQFKPGDDVPDYLRVVFRLACSMRPRAGKSRLVTEGLPLWLMLLDPQVDVLVATYSGDHAKSWGEKARDLTLERTSDKSGNECSWLPTPKGGARAPRETFTNARSDPPFGTIRYSGVGGAITGKGGQVIIGDDLIKDAEAAKSAAIRQAARDFYDTVWVTRKTRSARWPIPLEIMLGTRWHHQDVMGHAVYDSDNQPRRGWCVLIVPAVCENEDSDPLGRKEGEIHPSMGGDTAETLAEMRANDPGWFASLYQGRPMTTEDKTLVPNFGLWRVEGSEIVAQVPGAAEVRIETGRDFEWERFLSADMAATKSTRADFTVFGAWMYHKPSRLLFLLEMFRDRITTDQYLDTASPLLTRHNLTAAVTENVTYGQVFAQELQAKTSLQVVTYPATTDKVQRANNALLPAVLRHGRLLLPETLSADQRVKLINEVDLFPDGPKDDQVDMFSFAAEYVKQFPIMRGWEPPRAKTLEEEIREYALASSKPRRSGRFASYWSEV